MKVSFYATLRDLTGVKETREYEAETLRELLNTLCQRYGKQFAGWVWSDCQLSKDIIILVNGRAVEHLNGLETRLKPGDEVAIFPKLAGG